MGFFLFLAQLCRTNKFYISTPVYIAMSQFSDPEGQRFESSRSHQEQYLMGCCSFCFARILWGCKRGGFVQPVPPRFASRGAETPQWGVSRARLGESLRVRQKAHCNVLLQCAFYSDFRIILVAYHLLHRCTVLLTAVHFSVDLQWYT